MIAFITLFLGIATGVHTVELSASSAVARVELHVDGMKAADFGPPFAATIDLGPEIAPRELVAVAFDATGRRLGEARQQVNRATSDAEAGFALDERAFAAHLTLARRIREPLAPEPMEAVRWRVDSFALVESVRGEGAYRTLAEWPLEGGKT